MNLRPSDTPALSRGALLNQLCGRRTRELLGRVLAPLLAVGDRPLLRRMTIDQILPAPRRIVYVSDLHARSDRRGRRLLDRTFDLLGSLTRVDMLLLGGDYVDEGDGAALADLCQRLELLGWPIAGCWGNHDHGWPGGTGQVGPRLKAAGVRLLDDEAIDIAGLHIVGLPSCTSNEALARMEMPTGIERQIAHELLEAAISSRTSEALPAPGSELSARTVVLGHEPVLAAMHRCRLHLAGHTHWAQTSISQLAAQMLPLGSQPWPRGLYHEDGRDIYTSAGAGHHMPGRIETRPEVVVIDC
jgi:predicted MPP superfamily phosphohydrolase